jgi:Protein of unknown function (DUF1236)
MKRGSLQTVTAFLVVGTVVALTPTGASAESRLGYSLGRPSVSLGRPGRTLGHPTTELDVPLRKPAVGAGVRPLSEPRQPASLSPGPRGQTFQGSGGIAPDGSVPGGSLVALTYEQRGKLRDIIASQSGAQESSANFKLIIGAKVPQGVQLRPMPQEAVDLVPRYKDFDFAIVKDRIVVVQRSSRSIDTMIPR